MTNEIEQLESGMWCEECNESSVAKYAVSSKVQASAGGHPLPPMPIDFIATACARCLKVVRL